MASKRPFFVIVPAGSQNPTHYGYLSHLLQLAGYPTYSALLPSVGASARVSVEDDATFIRDRMLLPILEFEEHDIILILHSYSGVPGSAAAQGLGKVERTMQGKKTGVIGQIHIASMLQKGGDGTDILTAAGGSFPPHIRPDPEANVLRCNDLISFLYQEVRKDLADAVAASTMVQGMTVFTSPCPRASWDSEEYKGRVAYIRALNDKSIPLSIQQMMIDKTGIEWIVRDMESDHSPQLSHADELTATLLELAKKFETL
ncbi:hypothetical protein GX48_01610 [Paracoccidioides brasiliensis]|nr:hypothetical protein GX48_01610 [Paracoccidioides brasiliensis]